MLNRHSVNQALRIGSWISLVAAFALVNGCASGDVDDESGQSADPSDGEAAENLAVTVPVGSWTCMSRGLSRATLVVKPGGVCRFLPQERLGSSRMYCSGRYPYVICPDCNQLAAGTCRIPWTSTP